MKRKNIFIIVLIVSICIGVYTYKNYKIDTSSGKIILSKNSKYDASEEIKKALSSLSNSKKAYFIANVDASADVISLSFEGLSDKDTINKIVNMLDEYGIKATFFVPGIEAAEDSSIVETIQKSGHDIGSGTLSSTKNMEKLSSEELVTDFCRTNKILKIVTGKDPVLLKCNSTVYNDNILKAAYAAGNKYVVDSNHYLNYQSFKNYDQAYSYVNSLKRGTIISIKLEGVLDSTEYKGKEEKPSIDKQIDIDEKKSKKEKDDNIVQIVKWLLKSIDEQKKMVAKVSELPNVEIYNNLQKIKDTIASQYAKKDTLKIEANKNNILGNKTNDNNNPQNSIDLINFNEIVDKNNKRQAPAVSDFYTTQKALAYTFRGLSNEVSLNNVLTELDKVNVKGTFFVTKDEILKYPDRVNKVLSKGHEIANGGITTSTALLNKSPEEICKEIYEVDKLLKDKGIVTNAYMAGYGYDNSQIQEALSAVTNISSLKNYELFTYSKSPTINKYRNMSAEDIVSSYFNVNSYMSLRKGEIVYFRLDSNLFKSDNVVSNMIDIVTKNYVQNGYVNKYNEKSNSYSLEQKPLGYSVVTLGDLQKTFENSSQLGRYSIIKNPVSMKKRNYEDALEMMKTNYIGNVDVDTSDFSEQEKLLLDKGGTIDTKGENVIFFTFDDWGGDTVVNEILDVLNKHKVQGTFFVIAKNIDINSGMSNANPNLLRTIALNGNDIGSHNYNHELLGTNRGELVKSLVKSYDVMNSVIGDLDSLKQYFRPPTLILKREGLAAVFESGYKYSISGNISTHDYIETSAQNLVNYIQQGLVKNKGNVVVMHMNDQAYYTAEALDIFLTNNEKGVYGEKYKIAKLSDYLSN